MPSRPAIVKTGPDDVIYTCRRIDEGAKEDSTKPWVVAAARMAAANGVLTDGDDYPRRRLAAAIGVWRWVKANIAYVQDPHNGSPTEFLADCENILRMKAGDCDEHTRLVLAMWRALGFGAVIPAVGGPRRFDRNGVEEPWFPVHVFPMISVPGVRGIPIKVGGVSREWLVADTTIHQPFNHFAGDASWRFCFYRGKR